MKKKALTEKNTQQKSLEFLYKTLFGRIILKILVRPMFSKLVGVFMSTRCSNFLIKSFIVKNNINMADYENKKYSSYNDFFVRKIKTKLRPVDMNPSSFISPCDSFLTVYTIDNDEYFKIKGSLYSIYDLLGQNEEAARFKSGYCLIFRLCVDNYHRYIYIDNGRKGKNVFIKGILHTVNPIALSECNIYSRNCREYTLLETENFGFMAQIEVGALLVGKIKNHLKNEAFVKGEEKGMFEFGGSTIVLLVEKDKIKILPEILESSERGVEIPVKMGQKIAEKTILDFEHNN